MANSKEIQHNPGLTFEQAKAGYIDFLAACDWAAEPSFIYWWYATENKVDSHSVEAFLKFSGEFSQFLDSLEERAPAAITWI